MPSEESEGGPDEQPPVPGLSEGEREAIANDRRGEALAAVEADLLRAEQQLRHEDDRHKIWQRIVDHDLKVRKEYISRIWKLSLVYLAIVGALVLLDALDCSSWNWLKDACIGFNIATPVLVTMLGTTTATIIGLMYIVLRHHFPENQRS